MSTPDNKWWVECGAALDGGGFVRNKIYRDSNEINQFRFQHNNRGVFSTVYKYDNQDQKNSKLLADFYLDIDNMDWTKAQADAIGACQYIHNVYEIDPKYLKIYFSGKKGFHILVPYQAFGIQPSNNLNQIYKDMATVIQKELPYQSVDMQIYDRRRLLRMPNSIHPSTKLYKIPITYDELCSINHAEITKLAKEPRAMSFAEPPFVAKASMIFDTYRKKIARKKPARPSTATIVHTGYTPPCITSIINSPVQEGTRNASAAALASFYNQNGMTKAQARVSLQEWNEAQCDPVMSDYEVSTVLKSVYNGQYKMGCTWLSSIAVCDKLNCEINKKRR